jgi:hypothetical protein
MKILLDLTLCGLPPALALRGAGAPLQVHGPSVCLADPYETIGVMHGPSGQSLLTRLFPWDLQVGSLDVAYPDGRHETHPLLTGMLPILRMCPESCSLMH